jgi:hypothetical protein
MRFKSFINEIFTTYVPIRIIKDNANHFVCEFEVDDNKYNFFADNNQGEWIVHFDAKKKENDKAAKAVTNPSVVFSTVLKCLEAFLDERTKEVESFVFTTNNDSLKRIYEKMLDKFKVIADKHGYKYNGLSKNEFHENIFSFEK